MQNKHGQHHGDLLAVRACYITVDYASSTPCLPLSPCPWQAGVHTLEIIEYLWNSMLEMPNEAFVIAPGEEHDTFISLIVEVRATCVSFFAYKGVPAAYIHEHHSRACMHA